MDHFRHQHHITSTLNDLHQRVVSDGAQRWAFMRPDQAAFLKRPILGAIESMRLLGGTSGIAAVLRLGS